ncbi:hypothetical protein GWI33_014414 [Rhynchophorus ferrugineus]|uniref:Uncharacterized protein n=1 Tax=Rhynchophorus ferrugineus TaxID=354439 RepID=A0A834I2N1_RHYFE|nr:hypothetical protein GWI33_014414 [Rhynchophorus ferrugineus]
MKFPPGGAAPAPRGARGPLDSHGRPSALGRRYFPDSGRMLWGYRAGLPRGGLCFAPLPSGAPPLAPRPPRSLQSEFRFSNEINGGLTWGMLVLGWRSVAGCRARRDVAVTRTGSSNIQAGARWDDINRVPG